MAALLVVGTLVVFSVAGVAADTAQDATEQANESDNAAVDPGAQLAGVVDVQEAELEGDVEERTYGIQVAQANSNEARADVVGERLTAIEQRLGELERQTQDLDQARENGSMSEGEYRAKIAGVHARTQTVDRLANQSNETAQGLPADLLSERGIDANNIKTLRDRANQLSGPEVAEIARSIAGDNVGQSASQAAAGERGQDRGNAAQDAGANETQEEYSSTEDRPTDSDTETMTERTNESDADAGENGSER